MGYRVFGVLLVIMNIACMLYNITTGNWFFSILNGICAVFVLFILVDEWDEGA